MIDDDDEEMIDVQSGGGADSTSALPMSRQLQANKSKIIDKHQQQMQQHTQFKPVIPTNTFTNTNYANHSKPTTSKLASRSKSRVGLDIE